MYTIILPKEPANKFSEYLFTRYTIYINMQNNGKYYMSAYTDKYEQIHLYLKKIKKFN